MKQSTLLTDIRTANPVVHCMTNSVVANFQANGLLALGASPIMADSLEEASDVVAISACTLLNIGTLNPTIVNAMNAAGKNANQLGHPLVLDPVGAGATSFRKKTTEHLLETLKFTLIRGNAGEIAAIANVAWDAKGVDAGSGDMDCKKMALVVAQKYNCLVAITGETDIVTDGNRVIHVSGGHEFMSLVTGTGCLLSAVAAVFLAASDEDPLQAVAECLAFYKKSGEIAAAHSIGPGDFAVNFLNALHSLELDDVHENHFRYDQEVIS